MKNKIKLGSLDWSVGCIVDRIDDAVASAEDEALAAEGTLDRFESSVGCVLFLCELVDDA